MVKAAAQQHQAEVLPSSSKGRRRVVVPPLHLAALASQQQYGSAAAAKGLPPPPPPPPALYVTPRGANQRGGTAAAAAAAEKGPVARPREASRAVVRGRVLRVQQASGGSGGISGSDGDCDDDGNDPATANGSSSPPFTGGWGTSRSEAASACGAALTVRGDDAERAAIRSLLDGGGGGGGPPSARYFASSGGAALMREAGEARAARGAALRAELAQWAEGAATARSRQLSASSGGGDDGLASDDGGRRAAEAASLRPLPSRRPGSCCCATGRSSYWQEQATPSGWTDRCRCNSSSGGGEGARPLSCRSHAHGGCRRHICARHRAEREQGQQQPGGSKAAYEDSANTPGRRAGAELRAAWRAQVDAEVARRLSEAATARAAKRQDTEHAATERLEAERDELLRRLRRAEGALMGARGGLGAGQASFGASQQETDEDEEEEQLDYEENEEEQQQRWRQQQDAQQQRRQGDDTGVAAAAPPSVGQQQQEEEEPVQAAEAPQLAKASAEADPPDPAALPLLQQRLAQAEAVMAALRADLEAQAAEAQRLRAQLAAATQRAEQSAASAGLARPPPSTRDLQASSGSEHPAALPVAARRARGSSARRECAGSEAACSCGRAERCAYLERRVAAVEARLALSRAALRPSATEDEAQVAVAAAARRVPQAAAEWLRRRRTLSASVVNLSQLADRSSAWAASPLTGRPRPASAASAPAPVVEAGRPPGAHCAAACCASPRWWEAVTAAAAAAASTTPPGPLSVRGVAVALSPRSAAWGPLPRAAVPS